MEHKLADSSSVLISPTGFTTLERPGFTISALIQENYSWGKLTAGTRHNLNANQLSIV
jgi:hypothetical protein